MKQVAIALLFAFLLAGCDSYEETPLRLKDKRNAITQSLDKLLPEIMKKEKIPGASIAVIRDGRAEFFRSYGTANAALDRQMSEDTVFEAESLSKPVFAYIVLKLVLDGAFDIDRPLIMYAPELLPTKTGGWEKVTARQLLSHTSGAANYGEENNIALAFEPAKKFKYSGLSYDILQGIVEKVSGHSLTSLANHYVFGPLEMEASSFIWQDGYKDYMAAGHDKDGKVVAQSSKPNKGSASYSLYTTTKDYAKFVSAVIGELQNEKGVFAEMMRPHILVNDELSWGVGWGIQVTDPNMSFWHFGANPGFVSYVIGYPKEKIAVVVMANSDNLFKGLEKVLKASIGGYNPSYFWTPPR